MPHPSGNLLLDAYSKQTGSDISHHFELVPLPFKSPLFKSDEKPRYVHMITSGMASLVALMSEGAEVEVAMTGDEAFPEAIHLLGPEMSPRSCFMQAGGTALRMPFGRFSQMFETDSTLRRLVLRFVQYQGLMATQLVACNVQHDAEQRLARWLLMVQDRIHETDLPLTQEFLGQMLGSRRSTVTLAAGTLQRAGVIEYRRGQIRVLQREQLADVACECYGVIHTLLSNLYQN